MIMKQSSATIPVVCGRDFRFIFKIFFIEFENIFFSEKLEIRDFKIFEFLKSTEGEIWSRSLSSPERSSA